MNKKEFKEIFNIKKRDVISIVGSGGKTSLMYLLAKEYSFNNKVLITTSTKIYRPEKDEVDYEFYTFLKNKPDFNKGITVIGDHINKENKIICSSNTIKKYIKKFDYVFIESDGSKRKPLKGWSDTEPMVMKETTKTIGVIPLNVLGLTIENQTIHRIEQFKKITDTKEGEKVNLQHLVKIITSKKGLFKNSIGEKILFFNCIDTEEEVIMARKLLLKIKEEDNEFLNKVIGGNLRKAIFFEIK